MLFLWKIIFMLSFFVIHVQLKVKQIRTRDTYLSGCVDLLHLHPLLQQEEPKTESMKDHYMLF